VEELRAAYRGIGHSRTPGMLARLVSVGVDFLSRARAAGIIGDQEQMKHTAAMKAAVEKAGSQQMSYLEDADPVDVFKAAIRQALATWPLPFASVNGGVPRMAELLGWSAERSNAGDLTTYKRRGQCIGWVRVQADELFIDVTAGYSVIKTVAGSELSLTKQTLFKRLKDAGVLTRTDEGRSRNTVRIKAEGHPRQVLQMQLSDTLEINDVEDETDADQEDRDAGDDGSGWEEVEE
jgi:hypothetical protein